MSDKLYPFFFSFFFFGTNLSPRLEPVIIQLAQ